MGEPTLVEATEPQRPPFVRRFNPDGNERLTAALGLVLVALTVVELATLLLGLQSTLHLHVFVGLVLLPPITFKLASVGWRFTRYYTRNQAYRLRGAPQLFMRLLAPLLVAATLVLFGSGVAMGVVHGGALQLARRLHGPAAFVWTLLLGVHVLVYAPRALRAIGGDVRARTRRAVAGSRLRAAVVAVAVVCGLAAGFATLPVQHVWLHLPPHRDGHGRWNSAHSPHRRPR
ncbi:MAG TPA: hypothetical protein VFA05_09335 [Gaiellaceae bacterium]|nr:hypothetical protein [Gaiellaceae bacterium]